MRAAGHAMIPPLNNLPAQILPRMDAARYVNFPVVTVSLQ
jgi:hypothetical protein